MTLITLHPPIRQPVPPPAFHVVEGALAGHTLDPVVLVFKPPLVVEHFW